MEAYESAIVVKFFRAFPSSERIRESVARAVRTRWRSLCTSRCRWLGNRSIAWENPRSTGGRGTDWSRRLANMLVTQVRENRDRCLFHSAPSEESNTTAIDSRPSMASSVSRHAPDPPAARKMLASTTSRRPFFPFRPVTSNRTPRRDSASPDPSSRQRSRAATSRIAPARRVRRAGRA
jgi:hypothetical protein